MQAEVATERGNYDQSVMLTNKAIQLSARPPLLVAFLGYTYARAGKAAEAQKVIEELQARQGGYIALFLARIRTALGQHDEALRLLQQVYDDRSESIVWLKVDPTFDALRGDPRFDALLKRVGF